MISVEPTAEAVSQIGAIVDPVERAWTAESLHRSAVARAASAPDTAARKHFAALADEALQIRVAAIEKLMADFEEIRPYAKIRELGKRAWLAETIRRTAKARAKEVRDRRDRAGLALIAPFATAVAPTNIERNKAKEAYENGQLATAEYYDLLEHLLAQRHKALEAANVTIEPSDVYKPMGISRARFIQMMDEMSGELPRMRNATQVMTDSAREVERLVIVQAKSRDVRNAAIDTLLRKHSNADVARLTGLTTARMAQLRQGTR
jgi:hypothetical protein